MEVLTLNIKAPLVQGYNDSNPPRCGMNAVPIKRDPVKVTLVLNLVFSRKQVLMTDDVGVATRNDGSVINKIINKENVGSKVIYTYSSESFINRKFRLRELRDKPIETVIQEIMNDNKVFEISLLEASISLDTVVVQKKGYKFYNYVATYSIDDKPIERKMKGEFDSDFIVHIESTNKISEIENLISLFGKISCTLRLGTSSEI